MPVTIENKSVTPKPKTHNLTMENRKKLSVTGVIDVNSFNEQTIVAETELGLLVVRGVGLHISKLNLSSSELEVDGEFYSCEYRGGLSDQGEGGKKRKNGFLSGVFK